MDSYRLGERIGIWLSFALLTAALPGCGGPTAQVQGQVTHEGAPVARADMILIGADDPTLQFFGATGEDGKIYLSYGDRKGAPPGRYVIQITHITLRDGRPIPSGEEGAALRDSEQAVSRTYSFEEQLNEGPVTLNLKLEDGTLERPPSRENP